MSDTQQEIAAPESTNEQSLNINSEPQEKKYRTRVFKEFFSTKRITQLAVFIALAIVMKILGKAFTLNPTMTATLIYIPWLLSGIVLGPLSGLIVCCFSDVLGNLIFSGMSGFNPLTLLSNTLYALPVALLYKTSIKSDYLKTILGSLISLFVCTLGIGSFALYWYYFIIGTPAQPIGYWEWFILNRWFQPIVFTVNLVILCLLIKPLQKVGIFPAPCDRPQRFSYKNIIAVSVGILSAVFITLIILMIINTYTAIAYVMVSSVYLGLAAFLIVSTVESGDNKTFYNGVISIALSLLAVACGIIIYLSPAGPSFVPSGWFYLIALVPLAATAIPLVGFIKHGYTGMRRKTFIVNLAGITASVLSLVFLIIMITIVVTAA